MGKAKERGCTSITGRLDTVPGFLEPILTGVVYRLGGYFTITILLFTVHLAGAHSNWSLKHTGLYAVILRVAAYWIALPAVWLGLVLRLR